MSKRNRRAVFTFDKRNPDALKNMTEKGYYSSQPLQNGGFVQIAVRHPHTKENCLISIPVLSRKQR